MGSSNKICLLYNSKSNVSREALCLYQETFLIMKFSFKELLCILKNTFLRENGRAKVPENGNMLSRKCE